MFLVAIFTTLQEMQTWSSDENSVRLSVCQMCALWQNGRKISPVFIPYERSFSLVFWEERLVEATLSAWNFRLSWPRWSEIANFESIFTRSVSASGEKH